MVEEDEKETEELLAKLQEALKKAKKRKLPVGTVFGVPVKT